MPSVFSIVWMLLFAWWAFWIDSSWSALRLCCRNPEVPVLWRGSQQALLDAWDQLPSAELFVVCEFSAKLHWSQGNCFMRWTVIKQALCQAHLKKELFYLERKASLSSGLNHSWLVKKQSAECSCSHFSGTKEEMATKGVKEQEVSCKPFPKDSACVML